MDIGHFSYQPKLRVVIVVRHKTKYVKILINYFKMSKTYGSISQNMLKYRSQLPIYIYGKIDVF
jgi:hypothetical protein